MPAKPSGEIKTRIVHNTQKNGDIYVLERKTMVIVKNRVDKIGILAQNRVKIYIKRIDRSYLAKILAIRVYKHITRINQPYFSDMHSKGSFGQ